jgi:cysteine-rich repeat protein
MSITVQLMPYNDSPNNGDEYKAWMIPVGEYTGFDSKNFGFADAPSKTDNYKVRSEPSCGDGTVDEGEECDDGNEQSGDGCSATCEREKVPCCGDGILDAGEKCDDGNTSNGDGCSSTCQLEPRCGDGTVDAGEECDDGNTRSEDGCSSTCEKETICAGWCPVLL